MEREERDYDQGFVCSFITFYRGLMGSLHLIVSPMVLYVGMEPGSFRSKIRDLENCEERTERIISVMELYGKLCSMDSVWEIPCTTNLE